MVSKDMVALAVVKRMVVEVAYLLRRGLQATEVFSTGGTALLHNVEEEVGLDITEEEQGQAGEEEEADQASQMVRFSTARKACNLAMGSC
jgi:hypothetical protein